MSWSSPAAEELLTAHCSRQGEVPDKNREVGLLFAFIILICTESPLIMQFLHFPHFPCVGSQLAIVKRMTDGAAQQESGRVISPATPISSTNNLQLQRAATSHMIIALQRRIEEMFLVCNVNIWL